MNIEIINNPKITNIIKNKHLTRIGTTNTLITTILIGIIDHQITEISKIIHHANIAIDIVIPALNANGN